jgi:hypothetical protein
MKAIEKELDRLVQEVSHNQYCRICAKKDNILKTAEATHHIVGRANKMLRYDIINLMPVCYEHHKQIHDGKINQWDYIDEVIAEYLRKVKNASYKDFLLKIAHQTDDEYLRDCRNRLKKFCTSD